MHIRVIAALLLVASSTFAADPATQPAAVPGPALTIYNQNFAVVREAIRLDLQPGINDITFTGVTARLEPDSVVLRDLTNRQTLRILEQNYRGDPLNQDRLLSLFEGQTIDFRVTDHVGASHRIVRGKIVRSGAVPFMRSGRYNSNDEVSPIIEVDGSYRFSLPGEPLFPSLGDNTTLLPALHWRIQASQPGPVEAELAYITGGMKWKADYNVVAAEEGDLLDIFAWITIENGTGKDFTNASIKLMAGDLRKIRREPQSMGGSLFGSDEEPPLVQDKGFDEYQLYTISRQTTLLNFQVKQVEFLRASNVRSSRIYVYDGAVLSEQERRWDESLMHEAASFGEVSTSKVRVLRQFDNSQANHLGAPLPGGNVRFYRRDSDGRLEFIGENLIDHTPRDEPIRIYTGNAFDIVGNRRQTDFASDAKAQHTDESFEIRIRNHKKEQVEVRVTEHLYRGFNWSITHKSHELRKVNSDTIEFVIPVEPDQEQTITYTVHYRW